MRMRKTTKEPQHFWRFWRFSGGLGTFQIFQWGGELGPPPSDCKSSYLYVILHSQTIFAFRVYFHISGLYLCFQNPLALRLDYRLLPSFSTLFSDTLRTSKTIPISIFQYPIPFVFQFPLHTTIPTPPMHWKLHPNHPQHFPSTAINLLPSHSLPLIPSAHCPLNHSDFQTSQIPPVPDSLTSLCDRCRPDS